MVAYYLRIEGVNLSEFVYDTQDLNTIRGGSLMLLDAVRQVVNKVTRTELETLTTGASSGLFQFDAEDNTQSERVRGEVEKLLKGYLMAKGDRNEEQQYELKHATFVVDVLKASVDFVTDRQSLLALNRWRQMQSPSLAIPTQNESDWRERIQCEVDLVRPAVTVEDTAEGPKKVSASVKTRRQYGRLEKQTFYTEQTGLAIDRDFSRDFDELTADPAKGNLHHKMAVIFLDGNGFGKLQDRLCRTPADQKDFDHAVQRCRREFLKSLLEDSVFRDVGGWVSQADRYRIETLLWGGDEMIFVVPAWQGWPLLSVFYEKSKDWKFRDEKLTHAGGVVFCHHNAPISRIKDLAEQLAQLVKAKPRNDNLFTYQVLESFDHIGRDLLEFRKDRVPLGHDASELILPGANMGIVQTRLPILREGLPRRKLYQLIQLLQTDLPGARKMEEGIREQLLRDPDSCQPFKEIEAYFGQTQTMWFHIAELWDYIVTDEGGY